MKRTVFLLLIFALGKNLYASTELMAGFSSEIINAKSFDIFSDNDWLFGPAARIEQNIISGKPLYLNLSVRGGSSSNKIFDGIKSEFSLLLLSGGISYRYNAFSDIVYLYGGLGFIYGLSDIKFTEAIDSYTDSSNSYGGTFFGGLRLDIPNSVFRSEGWEKQHWHELVTIGIDIQAGYRLMTPLSYDNLKSSKNESGNAKQYNVSLGETGISGPYILTSVVFVF